jgi:hypothetical protein
MEMAYILEESIKIIPSVSRGALRFKQKSISLQKGSSELRSNVCGSKREREYEQYTGSVSRSKVKGNPLLAKAIQGPQTGRPTRDVFYSIELRRRSQQEAPVLHAQTGSRQRTDIRDTSFQAGTQAWFSHTKGPACLLVRKPEARLYL